MTIAWHRTAATSAILALLPGVPPCSAFLANPFICTSHSVKSSSHNSIRPRAEFSMSAVPPPVAAVVETSSAADIVPASSLVEEGSVKEEHSDPEMEKRWIKEVKAGMKLIGYVENTTQFAAFVEVGVVRRGAKGAVFPVTGFLHRFDIRGAYALQGSSRAKDSEVVVKKGIHLTTYVKDVFPNAGRVTLSLDPGMDKEKVIKQRNFMRAQTNLKRRARIVEKESLPKVGDVVEGYIRKVRGTLLIVDVNFRQLSVLRVKNIRNALKVADDSFVNLSKEAQPGDFITVRIVSIEPSKRKDNDDEKAVIDFVGWGGLDAEEKKEEEQVDAIQQEAKVQETLEVEADVDEPQASPPAVAELGEQTNELEADSTEEIEADESKVHEAKEEAEKGSQAIEETL